MKWHDCVIVQVCNIVATMVIEIVAWMMIISYKKVAVTVLHKMLSLFLVAPTCSAWRDHQDASTDDVHGTFGLLVH